MAVKTKRYWAYLEVHILGSLGWRCRELVDRECVLFFWKESRRLDCASDFIHTPSIL